MDFNQSEFEDQPPQPIRSSENTSMDHKSQSVFGHVSQRPMRSLETQRSQPEERRTRIPTRFRTAVNRVRRERSMPAKNMTETLPTPPRRSSIPRLKTKPPSPKPEEEFEKLFSEIANSPTDIDISLLNNKVEDPEKVEDIFEEIIHAYDENKLQPIVVETIVATPKQNDENKAVEKPKSKIPMLKRKSEAEIEVPKSVQTNAKIDPPADKNRFRDVATKVSKAETHESKFPSRIAVTKRSNVDSDNVKLKTSYQRVESNSKDGQKHEVRVENIAKVSLEQDISPDNVVNIDNVATNAIMESTVEIVSITPEIKPVNLSDEITAQPYSVEIVELPSTVEEVQNKSILIEEVTKNEPKTEVKKSDIPKDETKIPIDPVKIISMDEYQNMIREDIKEFKEFKSVSKVNRNGTVVHNDNNDYNIESCARDIISENKDFVAKPPNVEKKISNSGTDERVTQLRKTIRLDSKKETNDEDGEVKHKSVLSKIAMFEQHHQDDRTQPGFRPKPAVRCGYRRRLAEDSSLEPEINTSNNKSSKEFTTNDDLDRTKPKLPTSRIPEPQIRRTLVDSKPIIVSEIIKTVQPNSLSNNIKSETYNPVTIEAVNNEVNNNVPKTENLRISKMEIRTEEVAVSNAVEESIVENQTAVSENQGDVVSFDLTSSERIKRHHPNRYYSFEVDYSREYPVNVEKADEIEIKSLSSVEVEYSKPLNTNVFGEPKSNDFKVQETVVTELLSNVENESKSNDFKVQNTVATEPLVKNVSNEPKSNDVKVQDAVITALVNKNNVNEPQNNDFKVQNTVVNEPFSKNVFDDIRIQDVVIAAPVINNLVNGPKINDNKVQDAIVTTLHEKPKIEHVTDLKQSPFDFTPKTHENKSNKHKITPMMSTEEILNAYKAKNEDYNMRKAKSVAELDLGDAVKGKVHNLIVRMKSMDKSVEKKEAISAKERPRKKSVSEKIAMFEGIFTGATGQHVNNKYQREEQKRLESVRSEEEYKKLLEELTAAKQTYGQNTSMKKVTLSNGEEMPVMALGTALLDNRLAPAIIETAIDLGYRAFDTAFIYGNEKAVGEGIRKKIEDGTVKREDLFIINKLWSTFHRRDLVEKAYKQSLENLGLDYVDLYLVHNPMSFKEGPNPVPMIAKVIQYSESDYLDAWYGMEDLVTKGLVKSIGLSNFNSSQVQKILDRARVKPVVNQVECHPYLSQQRLYDFCDERHIKLSCFGVLGSKGTPQEHKNTSTAAIDDPMVKVMAAGLNVSPAQLLIRYQLQSDHMVVVKASTGAHLWDNLQALNIKLGQVEMDALRAMNRNKRTFVFKGMGDTHKNYPFNAPF